MSNDKRMFLACILCLASFYGIQVFLERTGLVPPPQKQPPEPPPAIVAKDDPAKGKAQPAAADKPVVARGELPSNPFLTDDPTTPVPVEGPKRARASEMVLGADTDDSPSAYHLRLQLAQKGAAVAEATSAKYDAELDPAEPMNQDRRPRFKLIDEDPKSAAPGSLAMTVAAVTKGIRPIADDDVAVDAPKIEAPLDLEFWEVVRAKEGAPAVRTATKPHPTTKLPTEYQEITFQKKVASPSVVVTKIYRLWKGDDGFEVELRFANPTRDSKITYRLFGPHGIPIEGEWYTSTFRDVFFGQAKGNSTEITTRSSTDVVSSKNDLSSHVSTLPLKFAGVEDQYFATFLQPFPIPRTQDDRWDQEAAPVVFQEDPKAPQKSDVGVEIVSRPIVVGPNLGEVVHTYRVFAGPKVAAVLVPFEAEDLASYRKNQWITIPFAATLAKNVISPLLDHIYDLTQAVARLLGWKNGNYGIAIILLTMTVRLIMFPLGRKQAMMAKKMQDLQPVLAEVKEKYKDDKDALTRETMAVWKRHKINPAAGCVPALIQMPIFVGLWQTLNNSVALRQTTFLYIRDLAAPDMLFKLPFVIPFLGVDYFNLLPILVVSLMLIQTKLFAPPPTTPEAETQQKMMKYMMILMMFMFYKVPSGLGLYFITSSLWQIGERLLLPKVISTHAKPSGEADELGGNGRGSGGSGSGGGSGGGGNGNGDAPKGWLGRRLEKLLEEAAKDKTIRNNDPGRDRDRGQDRDRDRTRNKPRPGRRR